MAQHARHNVGTAMMGIDDRTRFIPGHGIDGQIAAHQILLQRHSRRGMKGKADIARRSLAFGTGQRIFLMRLRMQEHREVAPDRRKAARQHVLGRGADHYPVAVLDRQTEQFVAHGTTHCVDFHGNCSTPVSPCPRAPIMPKVFFRDCGLPSNKVL